jgi:hypothetical protein
MKEFSKEEIIDLKKLINDVGNHLTPAVADIVWAKYTRIIDKAERKPCMCGKSAGHWRRAVETIREFVKKHD